jgi:putative NADPH-quinone reductase
MKILLILGHPRKGSFNHAIAETALAALKKNGHNVFFHDLHEENFDPLFKEEDYQKDVKLDPLTDQHCKEISAADGIIIVHPNWWGQPPAMLKGWVDRVMRPDITYKFEETDSGEGIPTGLLKAKVALVLNTSDTEEDRELSIFGDPLENIWKNCIFFYCGVEEFYRETFRIIATSTPEQRKTWLSRVTDIMDEYFPS